MNYDFAIGVKPLPLKIDTVSVPSLSGQIGISSCPGMKEFSTLDLYEDRVDNDLQNICSWGATVIVTLLEAREISILGIADLPEKALAKNILWLHLPMNNIGLPDREFEEMWKWAGSRLLNFLQEGQSILIHCKEGIGRSGIIAARLLIESGIEPDSAIKSVRKARPGSLMLYSQEKYCCSLKPIVASKEGAAAKIFSARA